MTNEIEIKYCFGCGIQLKSWKPGDDDFCGAYEQCIPAYELKMARKRIGELEAILEAVIPALQSIDWQHKGMSYAPEGAAVIRRCLMHLKAAQVKS
jgi:hypothetical protein